METYPNNQQNVNSSNRKRLSTPSLLFCKSGSKSPRISDSRMSSQKSPSNKSLQNNNCNHQINYCENHKGKQAQFAKISDGGQLYFCQKCAISLASQGHSVTKIRVSLTNAAANPQGTSFRRQKPNRQKQVETFLQNMRSLQGSLEDKKNEIKQKLISSQEFYGAQIQQINDYFQLVHQSLELEKNKCYNYILNERKTVENPIRLLNEEIERLTGQMDRIVLDIEENLETVFGIQEKVYKLVISQYDSQFADFSQKINHIQIEPVELRKIQFAGVPESIYSLSDLVIQSSVSQPGRESQFVLLDSQNRGVVVDVIDQSQQIEAGDFARGPQTQANDFLRFSFEGQKVKSFSKVESLQSEQTLKSYLRMWE